MELKNNEKIILQILARESIKGAAGYTNLTKKIAPKMSIEEIREALLSLEEKGLVRYMRTQDRNLLLGQITDSGLKASDNKYAECRASFMRRVNNFMKNIRGRNIVTVLALVLVIFAGGSYFRSGGFQASFLNSEPMTTEEVITMYGEENLDFGEVVEISYAGQLGEKYFYQVDTDKSHYLFTLDKDDNVLDVETLHR